MRMRCVGTVNFFVDEDVGLMLLIDSVQVALTYARDLVVMTSYCLHLHTLSPLPLNPTNTPPII